MPMGDFRIQLYMNIGLQELNTTRDLLVALTGYDQSKQQRKVMYKAFGVNNTPTYHPLISKETPNVCVGSSRTLRKTE
jgi:hypothetical protein